MSSFAIESKMPCASENINVDEYRCEVTADCNIQRNDDDKVDDQLYLSLYEDGKTYPQASSHFNDNMDSVINHSHNCRGNVKMKELNNSYPTANKCAVQRNNDNVSMQLDSFTSQQTIENNDNDNFYLKVIDSNVRLIDGSDAVSNKHKKIQVMIVIFIIIPCKRSHIDYG